MVDPYSFLYVNLSECFKIRSNNIKDKENNKKTPHRPPDPLQGIVLKLLYY